MRTASLETLQTRRLICERLRPEHLPQMLILLRDPRVSATLWPAPEPPSEAEVADLLAANVDQWERHGHGLWLLRDRETGEMVGRGGLQQTFVVGVHEIEAAWAIVPERWGCGLATELAQAALQVAFGPLGLPRVVAFTLPHNIASRRVMEKTGFRYEREIEHAGLPHVLYCRRVHC